MKDQKINISVAENGGFQITSENGEFKKPFKSIQEFTDAYNSLADMAEFTSENRMELLSSFIKKDGPFDQFNEEDLFVKSIFKKELQQMIDEMEGKILAKKSEHGIAMILCKNCGKHASFYTEKFHTPEFTSKAEGAMLLKSLVESNSITQTAAAAMQKELEATTLPNEEDPMDEFIEMLLGGRRSPFGGFGSPFGFSSPIKLWPKSKTKKPCEFHRAFFINRTI
jgi:hypothetical protein